jgi:hypothetical protein
MIAAGKNAAEMMLGDCCMESIREGCMKAEFMGNVGLLAGMKGS